MSSAGAPSRTLLLRTLRDPASLRGLSLREWDDLLPAAADAGVLSSIAHGAKEQLLFEGIPAEVRPHLESAHVLAERQRAQVEWEIDRIEHATCEIAGPLVLLKGAAYHARALSTAAGRLTSDIDLLVPRDRLGAVERALLDNGWEVAPIDARDQAYFRRWLHELPPLRHRRRRTVLDVHHTILPPTDRLEVDPSLLLEASEPLPGRRLRVLAPADMFLHSAAHLFRNGAWGHAVRDLMDMNAMATQFGGDPGFWEELPRRAAQLDLRIPCGAALRTLTRVLNTPVPPPLLERASMWRQAWPIGACFDALVDRALLPRGLDRRDARCERARALLAYWPVPRLRAMATPLFWTKRLPGGRGRGEGEF
ncbi:MAG: nucleotidyltransferase family protein [Vicinamibacterales bacterium]